MAFKYKFENLKRLAQHEEDEVKTRLAFKDGQIAEIDTKLANLKAEYDAGLEAKTQDLLTGNMQRVRMYGPYFIRLDKSREFHLEERERLVAQREKILAELQEKRRVRKIHEKLQERYAKKSQQRLNKREQDVLDDLASRKSYRAEEEHA